MTVVSSREFVSNQKRYFDLAINEDIVIKRGKNMFIVTRAAGRQVHYSSEFLEKIKKAEENLLSGNFIHIKDVQNLWESIP